jgi:micrococcal nuclease
MRTGIVAAAVAVCAALGVAPAQAEDVWKVGRVVDGDTISVFVGDSTKTVRVLGIDTPETKKPGYTVGCWGPEATRQAATLLPVNTRVELVPDATQDGTDKYGRTLVYVRLPDGRDFGTEMARAGAAKPYTYRRPVAAVAQIEAATGEAQAAQRGLWGPPCWGETGSVPR